MLRLLIRAEIGRDGDSVTSPRRNGKSHRRIRQQVSIPITGSVGIAGAISRGRRVREGRRAINRADDKSHLGFGRDSVTELAGVAGHTSRSACYTMGRRLIEKTGDIVSVQRQLGRENIEYMERSYAIVYYECLDYPKYY